MSVERFLHEIYQITTNFRDHLVDISGIKEFYRKINALGAMITKKCSQLVTLDTQLFEKQIKS